MEFELFLVVLLELLIEKVFEKKPAIYYFDNRSAALEYYFHFYN